MKSLRQLSKYLTVFFILTFSAPLWAGNAWDVAVVFLGKNSPDNSQTFQRDIDQNLLELARIKNTKDINLSVYRELPDRAFQFSPKGTQTFELQQLLGEMKTGPVKVQGKLQKTNREGLPQFLRSAFKNPSAPDVLVLYGHGQGAAGMDEMALQEMKSILSQSGVKLDILWLDSCFMANLEFLFEMRSFSDYTIASQESEFTSGLPFQTIDYLNTLSEPKSAALFLAKSYIESYSSLKKGVQHQNVSTSAATVTIVDNSRFDAIMTDLKEAAGFLHELKQPEQKKLKTALVKAAMENQSLVDFGRLLIELRTLNKNAKLDSVLTGLIRELSIDSVKKLKTNPRLKISPPVEGAALVFGFNNWINGHEAEYAQSVFSDLLPASQFVPGPLNRNWPVAEDSAFLITPFLPGVSSFHYYWINPVNGKILSEKFAVERTRDVIETQTNGRLIVYTAYTQAIGSTAEKYTGLNVTNPLNAPSLDAFETEFNQLIGWLKL